MGKNRCPCGKVFLVFVYSVLATLAAEDDKPNSPAASSPLAERTSVAFEALSRLPDGGVSDKPQIKAAVTKALASLRGRPEFVKLVQKFQLADQNDGLLEIAVANSSTDIGVEAMRLILANKDFDLLRATLQGTNASTAIKTVEALGNTGENQSVGLLLPILTETKRDPNLRKQAIRSLARTQDGAAAVLKLAKEDKLDDTLKFTASSELNSVRWQTIKEEAAKVLPLLAGQDSQPLPPMTELLKIKGDPGNGAKIFNRESTGCFKCHQINGQGADIGPNLSTIGTKLGKDALFEAILDPNAGISFGYETHQFELKSGDEAYGLLISETADEVAVKDLKGIVTRLKKSAIGERRQLKTSIMPTSLQLTMTPQELVDLVEYLFSLKQPTEK